MWWSPWCLGYLCHEPLWFSQVPVPDVMMPNSLLLPAATSEKSERDTPAVITAEGAGKYSGMPTHSGPSIHDADLALLPSKILCFWDAQRKKTTHFQKLSFPRHIYYLVICKWPFVVIVAVELLSRIWFFCDPMDCGSPGSSVHGVSQASGFSFSSPGDLLDRQILYQIDLGHLNCPWGDLNTTDQEYFVGSNSWTLCL